MAALHGIRPLICTLLTQLRPHTLFPNHGNSATPPDDEVGEELVALLVAVFRCRLAGPRPTDWLRNTDAIKQDKWARG